MKLYYNKINAGMNISDTFRGVIQSAIDNNYNTSETEEFLKVVCQNATPEIIEDFCEYVEFMQNLQKTN